MIVVNTKFKRFLANSRSEVYILWGGQQVATGYPPIQLVWTILISKGRVGRFYVTADRRLLSSKRKAYEASPASNSIVMVRILANFERDMN